MRHLAVAIVLGACASPPSTALYAHPWPDERLRRSEGTIDLSDFPHGTGAPLRFDAERVLDGATGFGLSSGVFFPFEAPLDPATLPAVRASARRSSTVLLVDVDPSSPERGGVVPIDVAFLEDAGPFGGTNLLAVLPYPGIPLAPDTLYAAVVTTDVRTADGAALPPDPEVAAIRAGAPLNDLRGAALDAHRAALDALDALGVTNIAARAVFRTGDPAREMRDALEQASREAPPRPVAPARLVESFDDYCVLTTELDVPVYQEGEPPYHPSGGGWARTEDGALALQRVERARVVITLPRGPMPDAGYPTAVFVRAGGGGDRPLVDRGPRDAEGRSEPGTGPAVQLARAGYAGIMVDGPLGGARNLAGWDEQFVLYDVLNPAALRDNVRQYALELALLPEVLDRFELDARGCDGATPDARLDPAAPALIAHSNGATIAPIAAAAQPRYRALVLSGAGGSWIRQVIHKRSPVPTRPAASVLFGYLHSDALREHDPMLSLLQWAGEPADPVAYGRALAPGQRPPLHVLVFQGVLDTYIPPAIANPVSLSLGLDLAGPARDRALTEHVSIEEVLELRGGAVLPTPVRASSPAGETRALVQHFEDGVEDGHEVLFQRADARRQLETFLRTLRDGAPTVVQGGGRDARPTDS